MGPSACSAESPPEDCVSEEDDDDDVDEEDEPESPPEEEAPPDWLPPLHAAKTSSETSRIDTILFICYLPLFFTPFIRL